MKWSVKWHNGESFVSFSPGLEIVVYDRLGNQHSPQSPRLAWIHTGGKYDVMAYATRFVAPLPPLLLGVSKMSLPPKLPGLMLPPKLPGLSLGVPPALPPLTVGPSLAEFNVTDWFSFSVHKPVYEGKYNVRVQHEPDGPIFERFYEWKSNNFYDGHVIINKGYVIEWQGVSRDS
jgi:hypothetical protein